jgi:histidinol-phosphate aminotransferase
MFSSHSADSLGPMQPLRAHRQHGGPDALGVPRFDFSTNSNACGPCPQALAAVQNADATRYPDATYTTLKRQLADFHRVDVARVVLAGSASEFIFRITAWVAQHTAGQGRVSLPPRSYSDYAQAAQAWGLSTTLNANAAQLVWACEPSSPLGQAHDAWPLWLMQACEVLSGGRDRDLALHAETNRPKPPGAIQRPSSSTLVLDCAYAPLRLSGSPSLTAAQSDHVWRLYSPNKSLGLTGVRAAYALAPLGSDVAVLELDRMCASWPVGAHGVAMLQAWVQSNVQDWLRQSLFTLTQWKERQIDLLESAGWTCLHSDANFFCAHPPVDDLAADLHRLRTHYGIKLRDATSFELPGHVRLGVLPPDAQDVLHEAICMSN